MTADAKTLSISAREIALVPLGGGGSKKLLLDVDIRNDVAAAQLKQLESLNDKEQVRHIVVNHDSALQDCSFLHGFPHVEAVTLFGKQLRSVAGVSAAPLLKKLIVETGSTNRTELSDCRASGIKFLRIAGPTSRDLAEIDRCDKIEDLEIVGGAFESFGQVARLRLRTCLIIHRRIVALPGLDDVAELSSLWVSSCSALTGLLGRAPRLQRLTVESCNKFEMKSVKSVENARSIRVMKCKSPFTLTDVATSLRLEELQIVNSAVDLQAGIQLDRPALKRLWVSPARESYIEAISRANSGVVVSNGDQCYVNGEQRPLRDYYTAASESTAPI